jgi:hypothetical protein
MPEATFVRDAEFYPVTLESAAGSGELRQMKDGRAAYYRSANNVGASQSDKVLFTEEGTVTLPKANGVVLLDGGEAFWDHSANAITYKPANDRDFYAGTIVGDFSSGDGSCQVNLNVKPNWLIDFNRDPFDTVCTGTQALGGFGEPAIRGGARKFRITATNEAQKVDMLSQAGFAKTANAIVKAIVNVRDDGSGTVVDVSVGVADDTHATNADTIANSIFIHLDANDLNIYAESDDGTTEVAATDTTIDYTAGTPFEVWIDMRDPADVQIYINAALVLGATTFNVDATTPTWKLLIHVEKSPSTDTYEIDVNELKVRIAEQ